MDAIQLLRQSFDESHWWYQTTIQDVTEEQANYVPSGRVHPIASLAVHILQTEDYMVNQSLQGRRMVWEADGWDERLGLPNLVRADEETHRAVRCNPAALERYAQAVYDGTNAYLDSLRPDDLDRQIEFGPMSMSLAQILNRIVIGNTIAHAGEISTLKGLQGAQGFVV